MYIVIIDTVNAEILTHGGYTRKYVQIMQQVPSNSVFRNARNKTVSPSGHTYLNNHKFGKDKIFTQTTNNVPAYLRVLPPYGTKFGRIANQNLGWSRRSKQIKPKRHQVLSFFSPFLTLYFVLWKCTSSWILPLLLV